MVDIPYCKNGKAYIKEIAYYLPDCVVTNEDIVHDFPEWSVEKIASKVGVNQRHVAASDETAVDLAIAAAEKLFGNSNVDRQNVDYILFCTQSPDYFCRHLLVSFRINLA